jgi:hypothetical protein
MSHRKFLAVLIVLAVALLAVSAALAQSFSADDFAAGPAATAHREDVRVHLPLGAMLAGSPPLAPASWSNLLSDGFEGDFPGPTWQLVGTPTWGKTGHRKRSGDASVYAVAGGDSAIAPPGPYPNNADAVMAYGPFSLVGATAAEVNFFHWTKTEYTSQDKKDSFCALASINGSTFNGSCYSGSWTQSPGAVDGWVAAALDLGRMGLLGQPNVWIAFRFVSDGSDTAEGSYLDDVVLRTWSGPTPTITLTATRTPTPTVTPSPTPKVCPGANRSTFVTLEDNENNAGGGRPDGDMYPPSQCLFRNDPLLPIEFRIVADPLPPNVTRALLSLRVWDVDEQNPSCPEVDQVLLNGASVGALTGASDIWSTTVLEVAPALLRRGSNLVQVRVNTTNCPHPNNPSLPEGRWCTGVNWGQLALGADEPASIRAAGPALACYWPGAAAVVNVEVDTTLASQEVRVEVNILDVQKNNLAGDSQVKTIAGVQNDPFRFLLPIPRDAATGNYTIQVIVYDTCSDTQNAYRLIPLRLDPACGSAETIFLPLILRKK